LYLSDWSDVIQYKKSSLVWENNKSWILGDARPGLLFYGPYYCTIWCNLKFAMKALRPLWSNLGHDYTSPMLPKCHEAIVRLVWGAIIGQKIQFFMIPIIMKNYSIIQLFKLLANQSRKMIILLQWWLLY